MECFDDHINTCKRHRMNIMDDYLASIGFQRKPIPKDGSCLFRALSEQLFLSQVHHLRIREACVCYMKRHQDIFENFIDDPLDEYLARMRNPKEWGDQLEISALSKLYLCDFYIYEQPGQIAQNVTENGYNKKVYLCHSGQKHYDSVYPYEYFKSYAVCQSIIYSVLFENILGMSNKDENKLIQTFRMLSHSKSEEYEHYPFPLQSIYEPSIGTFVDNLPAEEQFGLAYKLPVSLDFTRSLDPSVYRNTDYDFWITIKRKQQYIDFSVAEGMLYFIGDRCLVNLNIYSKPLVGHVQEVSPNNGPITVFIEALGDMHTIAVKNAKPLEPFINGCRSDIWQYRWRRRSADGNWNSRHVSNRKNSNKNFRQGLDNVNSVNFNPKYHLDFVLSQQKRMKTWYASSGSKDGQRSNTNDSSKFGSIVKQRCNNYSPSSSKAMNKVNCKHKWTSNRQRTFTADYLSSRMAGQLSLNQDSFSEDGNAWQSSAEDYNDSPNAVANPPLSSQWEEEANGASYEVQYNSEYTSELNIHVPEEESYFQGAQYWENDDNVPPCTRSDNSGLQKSRDSADTGSVSVSRFELLTSAENSNGTCYQQNLHSTPLQTPEEEHVLALSTPIAREYAQIRMEQNINVPESSQNQSNETLTSYSTSNGSQYVSQPSETPPVASSQGGYIPYSGSVTMYDCDGKEIAVADEKNPFQYFYNLGLECYRQMNLNNPRPLPVMFGGPVPPNPPFVPLAQGPLMHPQPQGPLMHPQPIGYIQPGSSGTFVSPPIPPAPGHCFSVPHFHPTVTPPAGLHIPFQPGRFVLHVPQTPHQYSGTSAIPSQEVVSSDVHNGSEVPSTPITSSAHAMMINDSSHDPVSTRAAPLPTSLPSGVPNYSNVMPSYQGGTYIPPFYPQPNPSYTAGVGIYEGGGAGIRPMYPPNLHHPSQTAPFSMQ